MHVTRMSLANPLLCSLPCFGLGNCQLFSYLVMAFRMVVALVRRVSFFFHAFWLAARAASASARSFFTAFSSAVLA